MAHGKNKYQSRDSRSVIRDVLMREWDPIGVQGIQGVEDEYDDYVGTVCRMLMDDRATEKTIADFLFDTATVRMGIASDTSAVQRCIDTAKTLVSLRPQFETH